MSFKIVIFVFIVKKRQDIIDDRRAYVADRVRSREPGTKVGCVIRKIAAELFLSEITVWKDYEVSPFRTFSQSGSSKRY